VAAARFDHDLVPEELLPPRRLDGRLAGEVQAVPGRLWHPARGVRPMTDYVIIEPDGELTLGEGYPANEVSCHGIHGQTLYRTRTGIGPSVSMLRMIECNLAVIMGEEHSPNPIAAAVLQALDYGSPTAGRVAICRIDWAGDPEPLTPMDIKNLRNMAAAAKAFGSQAPPPRDCEVDSG
jgi:hypothetical protein